MYYYIHTYVYTYIHSHWKELMLMNAKWYPVPTTLTPCLPRSYDFMRRWHYANPVLTTLPLGPYHTPWRLRPYYVNFEHVQNLTSSLSFLQTLLRSHHASTTPIPFLPCSSGSHKALAFLSWLVGWLVVFNVPSTARSFRDGTPIYCPLRRT